MRQLSIPSALLAALLLPTIGLAQTSQSAEFELRFDATWSNSTHPGAYPGGAHFSPLIGATHDGSIHLWEPGGIATQGIEVMAETGGTSSLTGEINTAIGQGSAGQVVNGAGIGSPASTTTSFTATQSHSKLSLVTMIAPSPDWFIGVDSVELFDNGAWIGGQVIELYAWDSGTDSGSNFNSPNQNVNPHLPIALVTGGPFFGTTPLGTFTITRKSGATYCDAKLNSQGCLPTISSTGNASAGGASSFTIDAVDVINNKSGILFYGLSANDAPFQGGTLCVLGPIQRTPVQNSGGLAGPDDCSGSYSFDMGAHLLGGSDASLTVGTRVFTQYWTRDAQSPSGTGLTNGLDFVILP